MVALTILSSAHTCFKQGADGKTVSATTEPSGTKEKLLPVRSGTSRRPYLSSASLRATYRCDRLTNPELPIEFQHRANILPPVARGCAPLTAHGQGLHD